MNVVLKCAITFVIAAGCLVVVSDVAEAQRGGRGGGSRGGGGGARPSMGRVGGGGGRPSGARPTGGSASRAPKRPQVSRPNVQRPSMANASRPTKPSRPQVSRPQPGTRPGVVSRPAGGGYSPSGTRPSVSRPSTRPASVAGRPSVRPPGHVRPTTPPSRPDGGLASNVRPGLGTRPTPGGGNRPTTLPGNIGRPGTGGDRPSIGGNRPGLGNVQRPTTLPGTIDRPGIGGDRPGIGGNRPGIGGNRPGIDIGGDVNIGSGNNIIGNRPGWNRPGWDRPDWNRPDWGWGGGNWTGHWHDHCIDHHHRWYNGCWSGNYWGSNWYQPLAWGAVGWGLGTLTSGWGYGTAYHNPYYVAPVAAATAPYNYAQPVVVNNYVTADADGGDTAAQDQPAPSGQALSTFDEGLAQFRSGDYQSALRTFDATLQRLPSDPVVHEVRALTLFALGQYESAAAVLNSFLSSAPGMDWTTMSSLYGKTEDYATQLRRLEQYCVAHADDPASHFVLTYHYLALGEQDDAVNALKVVVKNQPKDYTAKRMLDALAPPLSSIVATTEENAAAKSNSPETDLVGNWRAKTGSTTIDLAITEGSQFTWKATQAGAPPMELKGRVNSGAAELALETEDKGSMVGAVKSLGPEKWQFALSGAPPSDPGLSFERVKK